MWYGCTSKVDRQPSLILVYEKSVIIITIITIIAKRNLSQSLWPFMLCSLGDLSVSVSFVSSLLRAVLVKVLSVRESA